jgi:transposase InsO family protein
VTVGTAAMIAVLLVATVGLSWVDTLIYAWKRRKPSLRQHADLILLAHVRQHFALSHETYGSPRMHAELKAAGLSCGRHRIARLMRDNGLKALTKRRYKKTTDSAHGGPVAPATPDDRAPSLAGARCMREHEISPDRSRSREMGKADGHKFKWRGR